MPKLRKFKIQLIRLARRKKRKMSRLKRRKSRLLTTKMRLKSSRGVPSTLQRAFCRLKEGL